MRGCAGAWLFVAWVIGVGVVGTGVGGCAGQRGTGRGDGTGGAFTVGGQAGWDALAAGDLDAANRAFTAAASDDWAVAFGRITIAHAHGKDREALTESLALLEAVARLRAGVRQDRLSALLADATAARLAALFDSAVDARGLEDRLLALPVAGLPWRARLAVESAVDAVARRRGDVSVLATRAARAGCLTDVRDHGTVGRLPRLDLAVQFDRTMPAGGGVPARASGCRLWLGAGGGWPGVRVLRADVPAASVPRLLIIDHNGPALVGLDPRRAGGVVDKSGPGRTTPVAHESADVYGPRARAIRIPPSRVPWVAKVHLGTYGGAGELRLLVVPSDGHADDAGATPAGSSASAAGADAMGELARLLRADAVGDVDAALGEAAKLAARRRFAPGLIEAARVMAADPSRPAPLARADADGLLRRALSSTPSLARAAYELATSEQESGRGLDAATLAESALRATPTFWPAAVVLVDAQRARGLEQQADMTLQAALATLGDRAGACPLLQMAADRARGQHMIAREASLLGRLSTCDARLSRAYDWHIEHGDLDKARAAAVQRAATSADPTAFEPDLATLDMATGDAQAVVRRLRGLVADRPRDAGLRLQIADAALAAGDRGTADRIVADTVRWFPTEPSVPKLARLRGLRQPIEDFHQNGRAIIAEYQRENRDYAAPAVLVLDRTVMRVLDDGTQVVLTHNIVNVKGKDGIARWGEVEVPPNAEILALRTHKADGTTREPEDISGKETISAPDLAPGDFVEWETVEHRAPSDGVAPGFLTDRFYFQSSELPLHLSQLVLVLPAGRKVDFDARAGAPSPQETRAADGARVLTFTARHRPQFFPERAAVRPEEWLPSVRASAGVSQAGYLRSLRDGLLGVARSTPALRAEAARIAAGVVDLPAGIDGKSSPSRGFAVGAALSTAVLDQIDAEPSLFDGATATLARRRGNRAGLIVALARASGIKSEFALARPRELAAAQLPAVEQELDDFNVALVRLQDERGQVVYIDPRTEHATFGYLPPQIDGARVMIIDSGRTEIAHSTAVDRRQVSVRLQIDGSGKAGGDVIETLFGWPAIEWAAFAKATSDDPRKQRQEFEQRYLGQQFPGARLGGLAIDIDAKRPGQARLRYSFADLALGTAGAGERVAPSFFRVAAARRYATAATRRTSLLLGPEIPLELEAEMTLPPGSRVLDVGRTDTVTLQGPAKDGAAGSLHEVREVLAVKAAPSATTGGPRGPVIRLRRSARMPLLRIDPPAYDAVAAQLRRMDALERAEIRVSLPAATTPASAPPPPVVPAVVAPSTASPATAPPESPAR